MRSIIALVFSIIALTLGISSSAPGQQLQVIQQDPVLGPICAGPLGPGPCQAVQQYIQIQQIAAQIQVQFLYNAPPWGPTCAGPLGPGPCNDVRNYLALQQLANQQFQLRIIANAPDGSQICAGPLGPGPCEAIRVYLMQNRVGMAPTQQFDPRQAQVVGNGGGNTGALCNGPFGPTPCLLAGQIGLDRVGGAMPSPASFGVSAGQSNPQTLATACAKQVGLDVAAFAGCAGQQVILPDNQQAVLDCAVSHSSAAGFADCAAPKLGINLSDDQKTLAGCAMKSQGDQDSFVSCAGDAFANRDLTGDERAVLDCASNAGTDVSSFADCASGHFLSGSQKAVLDCAVSADDAAAFATCAAPNVGIKMSDDQRVLARCAVDSKGDGQDFATCAGAAFLGKSLGPKEQAVLGCAASSGGDTSTFAACSATNIFGDKLSPEQQVAVKCAAQSQGDATGFATCAGANMFNLQLNPEQQIAVQCVVSTGGQPYAAAGCIGSRLTIRELTKCLTEGVGGHGCFGDNNDLVGRNGWVMRTMGQVAGGPHSIINDPNQIWGGDNSFVRNPGQIFGGSNSFVRNPSQVWGGPNSVFNNPSQLLPKPATLGTIAGKRICLPWC